MIVLETEFERNPRERRTKRRDKCEKCVGIWVKANDFKVKQLPSIVV